MTNEELLEHIRGIVQEEVKAEIEPIKTEVQPVEQVVTHIRTGIEALAVGQQDIRQRMATQADVQDMKVVLVKHQQRIENGEENIKTPNPNKN